jgi:FeS assembly SUF system protein
MENKRQPLPLESDQSPVPPAMTSPQTGPADAGQDLEPRVIAALRTCYDPEIPVNIYELGLIYKLDVDAAGKVNIRMTLTSPACPVAGSLPGEVQAKVQAVPGVTAANVELVWDPPWDKDRMSEAAMLELGLF